MHGTCGWQRVVFEGRKDGAFVCIFSIFGVYARTHTHTLHLVCSGVSQRVGARRLESPKNSGGQNFGMYASTYVYNVHVYMYSMLGGGMKSGPTAFFLSYTHLHPEKKKAIFRSRRPSVS